MLILGIILFLVGLSLTLRKRRIFIGLVSIIAGVVFLLAGASQIGIEQPTTPATTPLKTKEPKPALRYHVLREDTYDSRLKAQVVVHALVSGNISKATLKELLQTIYERQKERRDFSKYHTHPTHVAIYLYRTRAHYESGMGQWIAMLVKTPNDKFPEIQINEWQLATVSKNQEVRFGLTEDVRMRIWQEIVRAEDKAWNEAQRRYPKDINRQAQYEEDLRRKYLSQIRKRYKLTQKQIEEISAEGLMKDWPFPKMAPSR